MATAKTTAEAWIQAGLHALAEGGPDAVRIEALAAGLGVTKGGFYWHFSGRADLIEQMLDAWERTVVDNVITELDVEALPPRERLAHLFSLASESIRSDQGLGAELAIRDWARREPAVADRLRRIDEARMAYMRGLFRQFCDEDEAEARCLQVYALLVGSYFVKLDHGRLDREHVVRRALGRLLE